MDAILSLPVISYLVVPYFGTYSASLNLLFFYMTWSTLVLSQPPLRVEVIGTLGVRVLCFLIPATLFLILDTLLPSLAVGIKVQGAPALPTRTGGIAAARTRKGGPQWYYVVGLSLFNVCLGVAIQAGVEFILTQLLEVRSALKLTTTLPMPWSIAKDVARGLLLREILQYYLHRILHPSSPNYLSNLHKSYHHSIIAPYSFASHYDHPLPYLFWRFLPTYLPCALFRVHLLTYLLLLSLISLEETLTLSGYTIIPGVMLGGFARRQDMHSQSQGKGNFAPWGLMDWLHGTSVGADVVDDMRDEAGKHQVAERGDDVLKNAKASGREGLRSLNNRRKTGKKS
ncbi:MAG: hypothetical protein M1818_005304 [Claussenomyces sp. TS43310]|nr:MAG: hypothetical protein M1818_005304 [Claussenomyces sp. TS43310]